MLLLLKAKIAGGAAADLFLQPVQVKGYTNEEGHFVAPHTSHRLKSPDRPKAAEHHAPVEPDLFSAPPAAEAKPQPTAPPKPKPPDPAEGEPLLGDLPDDAALIERGGKWVVQVGEEETAPSETREAAIALARETIARPAPVQPKRTMAELVARTRSRRELAAKLDAEGKPVRFQHPDGRQALAGPDMSKPGTFRFTRFDADGPLGHSETETLGDAIFEALQGGFTIMPTQAATPTKQRQNSDEAPETVAEAPSEIPADKTAERQAAAPVAWGVPSGTSKRQRRAWNAEAVALLQKKGDGPYTDEDRAVLARYTGTGGIGDSLNQFYTPVEVARAMWDELATCGFEGGDVLEPSAGTGVFLHTAPPGVRVVAVEMDPTAGAICGILGAPSGHETNVASLERFATQDGRKFAAVIGNPPFGPRGSLIADDKRDLALAEQYFVDSGLDKLQDGGLLAFILPTRIMDSMSGRAFRQRLLTKAQFIGGHRLPNTAFEAAHTEVVSDVLIFRKRPAEIAGALSTLDQDQLRQAGIWDEQFLAGRYFTDGDGSANVLGSLEPGWRAKAYGDNDLTVTGSMEGIPAVLAAWRPTDEVLAESDLTMARIMDIIGDDPPARRRAVNAALKPAYQQAKLGDTRSINGVLYILQGEPPRWHRAADEVPPAIEDAHPIADMLDSLLAGRATDPGFTRAELIEALDQYVADHGIPSRNRDLAAWLAKPTLPLEPGMSDGEHAQRVRESYQRVARLLGAVDPSGRYSDLVTGNQRSAADQTLDVVAERLALEQGIFTVPELVAEWGHGSEESVLDQLYAGSDYALADDGQGWTTMDVYLSGELWPKYDRAVELAEHPGITDAARGKYRNQAERLQEAIAPVVLDDVEIELNSGFVPTDAIAAWVNLDRERAIEEGRTTYLPAIVTLTFDKGVYEFRRATADEGGVSGGDYMPSKVRLIDQFLNRTGVRRDDLPALNLMNEEFRDWLLTSEFRGSIEEKYNRTYRGFRAGHQSDAPIALPGLNPDRSVNAYHWQAIRWAIEAGKGILAGDVGLGKTTQALLLGALMRLSGKANKPTYVVPKTVLSNWLAEAEVWFPGSKVLAIGETQTTDKDGKIRSKSDDAETRRRKYHEMQQNDYDFIFISQPAWDDLDVDPITKGNFVNDDFWVQRGDRLGQVGDKQLNRIRTAYDQAIASREFQRERQNTIYFNDLGVDLLIMDEGHAYKNLYAVKTRFGMTPKFLGGSGLSNRALDTFFKTRTVRDAHEGNGVFMLTATPTKNSPLEVYSMLAHIAPEQFERLGIKNSEDFLDRFCEFETDTVLSTSGQWEERLITKGFKNLDELREVMKRYIDRKTAEDVGLKVPSADIRTHLVDMTADQEAAYVKLREAALPNGRQSDGTGSDHIFSIMDRMGKASLDMALLGEPDTGTPKIDACVAEARERVKDGGQIIFCEPIDLHEKIKAKLVASGVPANQIAIINAPACPTSAAKQTISDAFNVGKIKVVIANRTAEEGVNLQKQTTDIHHLDLPWNPASLQQRNGRGRRQGNKAEAVRIHTYFAKGSFDGYKYQTISAKKDWQDLLWNGGDRVENLAMEGAVFSPQQLLVALAPDPEAAAARVADDKAEAERQKAAADRVKAVAQFNQMRRMRETLADLKRTKSGGGEAAARLEGAISQRRSLLQANPAFAHKDLLDGNDPVVIEPTTGFAWRPNSGLELTPGPAAPAEWGTKPSRWVVRRVNGERGEVTMRPFGDLSGPSLHLRLNDLRSGVAPYPYDPEAEATQIESEAHRIEAEAGNDARKFPATSIKDVHQLPMPLIERLAPILQRQIKEALKGYKDDYKGNYPLLDEAGAPKVVKQYDAAKLVDTHDVMLPTEANRAKAIEGYVAMAMGRSVATRYVASGRKRFGAGNPTGVKATYPGFEYVEGPDENPWRGPILTLFDPATIDKARAEVRARTHAAIAQAPDFQSAVKAAQATVGTGYSGVQWPKDTLRAVADRMSELRLLDQPIRQALPRTSSWSTKAGVHEAMLKIGNTDFMPSAYGHDMRTIRDFLRFALPDHQDLAPADAA